MNPLFACLVVLLAASCAMAQATRQSAETFETKQTLRYLKYVPKGYADDPTDAAGNDGRGWPLVLFLHGIGERGTNAADVARHGPPKLASQGRDFPFILISPQCPPDRYWDSPTLIALLDQIQRDYKIDPDRVYLTGLSMGGFGTWALLQEFPDRFAAAVPICGGGNPNAFRFNRITTVPIWAFHGDKDELVPVARSQQMIDAIQAAGGTKAKLTIYPNVGHDSWTRTYEDEAMWTWLLAQKRPTK
jgi:predicted peptidase